MPYHIKNPAAEKAVYGSRKALVEMVEMLGKSLHRLEEMILGWAEQIARLKLL